MKNLGKNKKGFTLVEVILTLVVIAIFSTMVIPFFFSGITSNYVPIERLKESSFLNNAMNSVVSDYENLSTKDASSIIEKVSNFSDNYGTKCPNCTASVQNITSVSGWKLPSTGAVLVTITNNSTKETLSHVFSVQTY